VTGRGDAGGMRIVVGLETGRGGVLAHALDLPGCIAAGNDGQEAISNLPTQLGAWLRFLAETGEAVPPPDTEIELAVDEWIETGADVEAGESTVLFDHDRDPISREEVDRSLTRLGDLRARLLRALRGMSREAFEAEEGTLSISRVLDELARSQWWTLSRLGASAMAAVPEGIVARLDTAQALTVQRFTELPDDRRGLLLEIDGEHWTPRKVMRRMLGTEWSLGRVVLARARSHGDAR